ncbi:alanine racemase [Mesorhizobium japonicum]|uniref:Alanine racemase, biosynthetic n=1 Tax=Mesorhizobium japonicum (strain LMG 29417 / CECT 9101 / MAFF 303099) TaxID=266835 RepID=ALR1_RHILO|nr:alanine racemase [Mesorhizobium japonicum]Q98A05.1 RecName: Full=Alanine racemase, biosynthetic [Mesorhizobium japonicum MAFF 303099]BAB52539.1 alanine racemase [Mesorhizobium japonicum MAFF 303099]
MMLSIVRSVDVVLEIDLAAIRANFQKISTLVGDKVKVAAVVKSDAYGLGLVDIARTLIDAGCDLLFVANLDEALLLRSSFSRVAIAVFRDEFDRFGTWYRSHGLIPVVNNCKELHAVGTAGEPQSYFLNVETGFSRFGLSVGDIQREYLLRTFERYRPSIVLSHLACGECISDPMNQLQRDRFRTVYDLLKPTRGSLSASAGVWLGKSYHFDMVRVGSALYGIHNAGVQTNPLKPVVKLRARILDVRSVPAGEAVGYGATFRTDRASRVAIVGIGYKHGLPWSCANKIFVRLAEYSAPSIGRISMEYMIIDITDVPARRCSPGTFAELLSEDFTVNDLGAAAGVSPQEALTRLGAGCTRKYLNLFPPSAAFTANRPTEAMSNPSRAKSRPMDKQALI